MPDTNFNTIVTVRVEYAAGAPTDNLQVWKTAHSLSMWATLMSSTETGVSLLHTDTPVELTAEQEAVYRVTYHFGDFVVYDNTLQDHKQGDTIVVGVKGKSDA